MAAGSVYAFKIHGRNRRLGCQSGGAFAALGDIVLENKGVVYGVAYQKPHAVYERVVDKAGLKRLSGSKYVQAKLDCFRAIEADLSSGRLVLFSGTPCYVAAVLKYLDVKHVEQENLITVEILCHGVPSPRLFAYYLQREEGKNGWASRDFIFRDKRVNGWGGGYSRLTAGPNRSCLTTSWMDIYNSDRYLRECCYNCRFTKWNREADITVADFWGIQNISRGMRDNMGLSMILFGSGKCGWIEEQLIARGNVAATTQEANDQGPFHQPASYREDGVDLDWDGKDFETNAEAICRYYDKKTISVHFGIPLTGDVHFWKEFLTARMKRSWLFLKAKTILVRGK